MTRRTVEAAGVALAVEDRGEGPAVLFLHGPALAPESFEPVREALEPARPIRAIAYPRRAYGASVTYEPFRGTTVSEQAEDAVAVLDALEVEQAVVVGEDVGALVALDLMLRHRVRVAGALLVEPALLSLVPAGREAVAEIHEVVQRAAREDGPAAAVEAYLELAGGPGVAARLDPEALARARESARPLAADLAAGPAWGYSRRVLRAIDAPVTVLSGRRSPRAWREVAAGLADLLPLGRLAQADAGHLVLLDDPTAAALALRALAATQATGSTKNATAE